MADPMTIVLLVSTTVSLLSASIGVASNVEEAYRSSALFPHRIERLQTEVTALRGVVDECYETVVGGPVQAPPHVKELLIACFDQGKEVEKVINKAAEARRKPFGMFRVEAVFFILSPQGKQLDSSVAVFRDKVGILRDACSEVRLRSQLVELSAGMARIMDFQEQHNFRGQHEQFHGPHQQRYEDEQGTGDAQGPRSSAPASPSASRAERGDQRRPQVSDELQIALRDTLRTSLTSWAVDDFVLNGTVRVESGDPETTATVLVEDPRGEGGQRFRPVPAAVVPYYPARIKMDTGSTGDFVTLDYLSRAGFNISALTPIPTDDQEEFEGLDQVKYKPRFKVNLRWYRQGESQVNDIPFYVVDQGPFDLLLSSRRFAAEAERRLCSLPLVRPWRNRWTRKRREEIESEIEKEKKKLEEAKEQEQREFDTARARRIPPVGRVSTVNTVASNGVP